ncbi:NADP-dependent oxidoreductase domain-containing protein [Chaetomium sp. MPI-CAGE-AT-0009]|nr:NADP-dependent oxidoreductase domain-containing protein [Chaetomium sp. MPI-CAGE-AT-0009]
MGATTLEESQAPTLRNGNPIPQIIYGTARRKEKAAPDVRTALQLGYRAIDTASSRRFHHETEDGRALREFLDAKGGEGGGLEGIFVQSKFAAPPGHDEPLPYSMTDDTTAFVLKSVLRSADDLGVDVLDAYFLHAPLPTAEGTVQALLQFLLGAAAAVGLRLCILDGTTSPDHMRENLLAPATLVEHCKSGHMLWTT